MANEMTIGSVTTGGSTWQPWPDNLWTWPTNVGYYTFPPAKDYANKVEVERGEHDAVLRFYRTRENSQEFVKEITVPLGVLDWLTARDES